MAMKYIITILCLIFALSGCDDFGKDNIKIKQQLIERANDGDIKSMLTLNKNYLFPLTAEGRNYYSKWYELVLKGRNAEDILFFAKIFNTYNATFINGKNKYFNLLQAAADLGNKEALFLLLHEQSYKFHHKVEEAIALTGDKTELIKLVKYYNRNKIYNRRKLERIIKILKEKYGVVNYELTLSVDKFESLYTKGWVGLNAKVTELLQLNDQVLLSSVGDLFFRYRIESNATKIYQKLVSLDDTNAQYHYQLSKAYRNIYNWENLYQDDVINELRKASFLDDYQSTIELLEIYSQDFRFINKMKDEHKHSEALTSFIAKISQMNQAKRALGYFYYSKKEFDESYNILDGLAENRNEEAMLQLISLMLKYPEKAQGKRIGNKWVEFILHSEKPALIAKLYDILLKSDSAESKIIIEKVENFYEEKNNLFYFRSVARKNPKVAEEYLLKATHLGDVGSQSLLARLYLNNANPAIVEKGIALYSDLSDQGDINATLSLADFYYNPRTIAKSMQDYDKAIKYFEKAITLGDISSMQTLSCIYLCGDYKRTKDIKYYEERVDSFVNTLVPLRKNRLYIYNIAKMYSRGYGVRQDFNKAIYYNIKAAEAGLITAYTTAAGIYRNKLKDNEKYLELLHKGIDAGDSDASLNLGNYYLQKKDYTKALKYFAISLADDGEDAGVNIAYMYKKGLGVKADGHKALSYYLKSYNMPGSYAEAAYGIGLLYQWGTRGTGDKPGIKQDFAKAKKWYFISPLKRAKDRLKEIERIENYKAH